MLLKRLTAIAAVFFLLTVFSSFAYADTFPAPFSNIPTSVDANTAKSTAEQSFGIFDVNKSGDSLNYMAPPPELQVKIDGVQTNYGYLVYGEPHDFDTAAGRNRYAGYDYEGDDYTNLAYPPDQVPNGANFESEQWISTPWAYDSSVQAATGGLTETQWDDQQYLSGAGYSDKQYPVNYLLTIGMNWLNTTTGVGGTNGKNGYAFDTNDGNALWNNLYQYVNIMMPPTTYTWGIARMWHMYNGYPYYVDIPMAPLISMQLARSPQLIVEPSSATINVDGTEPYTTTYYSKGKSNGNGANVTTSSAWSDDNNPVATIGTDTGIATGVSAGTTNITATYTPSGGSALTGTVPLTVQQAQQPGGSQTGTGNNPPGGNNPPDGNNPTGQVSGALSFTAVSQAGASRPAGTAEWTDMVTARLTSDAPPAPTASSPNYITGWTWSISNVTLNYPAQAQPGSNGTGGFSFGYPVDPPGQMENGVYVATTMTPVSMTTQSGSTANTSFREAWSMDGVGSGRGIYSIIKKPPGIMAATATPFDITAAWTVQSKWTLMVYEGKNLDGNPIFSPEPESQNYTGTCSGTLKVNGSGVNSLGNNNNGN